MSLKINNQIIITQDLIGGNDDVKYFDNLTQLIPNKLGYKLFGSPAQREQLKRFVNDNFSHNIIYTPTITNIVNPGDNEKFYSETPETHNIYSDFSTSKYIMLAYPFMPGDNSWSIIMRVKTPSNFSTANQFWGSHSSYFKTVGGEFGTNQHFGFGITSNGTSWNIGWIWGTTTISANTWYYVKASFTGEQYKLELSTDNKNWNLEGVVNSTAKIYQQSDSLLCFGHMGSGYLSGLFDLSATKIIIGNTTWFDGSTKDYSYQIIDVPYKKVIDNQIIYSNFSTSNYLRTVDNFIPENNNWSAEMAIITGNNITDIQAFFSEKTNYSFSLGLSNSKLNYNFSSNGTSWTTSNVGGNITLNTNTKYYLKFEYNCNTKTFNSYLKTENGEWQLDYTNIEGVYSATNYLQFGVSRTSVMPFTNGNIILDSIKIFIDNTIWFDGESATAQEFSLIGSPTMTEETVSIYDYFPFSFSFNINSSTFTRGTKYLLEHPNLIRVKTENNTLYFNFLWKDIKWYYLPDNILQNGDNTISLIASSSQGGTTEADQIKLIVNGHSFTLVSFEEIMPLIATGVLGYKENLVF